VSDATVPYLFVDEIGIVEDAVEFQILICPIVLLPLLMLPLTMLPDMGRIANQKPESSIEKRYLNEAESIPEVQTII